MITMRKFKIGAHERGLLYSEGEFQIILDPGRHWFFDPLWKITVQKVSVREAAFKHKDLDVIIKSGALKDIATVVDLKDNERALVWIDGRFDTVLKPGLHAFWKVFHEIRVEIVDVREVRFEHEKLPMILGGKCAGDALDVYTVDVGSTGLFFKDGEFKSALRPGTHAFWKGVNRVRIHTVDLREQVADVAGQEIVTADKVTLRLNAVVTFRVTDALKAATEVEDYRQALYREAQLALRAAIGTRELDALLSDKESVAMDLGGVLKNKAAGFGVEVNGLGIRDIILPGEMKDLMNKVTEAKKAAEATLITRREETAAMRMQANTAKILESNPTLMRIRELEVLEKISEKANLKVVLGDSKGLVDRVVKVL